jgi:hypothetical protein
MKADILTTFGLHSGETNKSVYPIFHSIAYLTVRAGDGLRAE